MMTTRTMLVMKMMILPLPKWKPTKMGMTDALEGCRKFSSRTKARGLSRAARAGGSSRFTGGQIPRMRIPNFEVTGQKKWERMEAGGARWRHVEGKLRPKSNFFSGTKYFFSGTKYFLSGTKYFFRHKMWEQVKYSLLFTTTLGKLSKTF